MSELEILGVDNALFGVGDFKAGRRFYAERWAYRPSSRSLSWGWPAFGSVPKSRG